MEDHELSLPNASVRVTLPPGWTEVGPPDPARLVFGDPERMGALTPGVVVVVTETPRDPDRSAGEAAVTNFAMLRTDFTVIEIDGSPMDMTVLSVYRQGMFSIVSLMRSIAVGEVGVSVEALSVIEEFSMASSWIRQIPATAVVTAREPAAP